MAKMAVVNKENLAPVEFSGKDMGIVVQETVDVVHCVQQSFGHWPFQLLIGCGDPKSHVPEM